MSKILQQLENCDKSYWRWGKGTRSGAYQLDLRNQLFCSSKVEYFNSLKFKVLRMLLNSIVNFTNNNVK